MPYKSLSVLTSKIWPHSFVIISSKRFHGLCQVIWGCCINQITKITCSIVRYLFTILCYKIYSNEYLFYSTYVIFHIYINLFLGYILTYLLKLQPKWSRQSLVCSTCWWPYSSMYWSKCTSYIPILLQRYVLPMTLISSFTRQLLSYAIM